MNFWYLTGYIYIFTLSSYYLFYGFSLFLNTKKSLKILQEEPSQNSEECKFLLLVPALREQDEIEKTLKYLSELNYDFDKVKIIVISTEKEFEEVSDYENSTPKIIENIIPELNEKLGRKTFSHLHYPEREGCKADQLNYALEKMENKNSLIFNREDCYVGLYDVDSFSSENILKAVAANADEDHYPPVYQQPVINLKNYDSLPRTSNGFFAKSFAVLQSRYALGYEVPMYLTDPSNFQMKYCLGHGLFVRANFLKEIGFFPSPIEDTRFGHLCSFLEKEIKLIKSLAVTGVPKKITTLLKQNSVWFTGESYIFQDYKDAKIKGEISKLRAFLLLTYKSFRNFIWATEGLLFSVAFLIAFLLPSGTYLSCLIALTMIIYVYPSSLYLMSKKKLLSQLSLRTNFSPTKKSLFAHLFFLPLVMVTLFIGPQIALIRFIKTFLSDSKIHLPKTERE